MGVRYSLWSASITFIDGYAGNLRWAGVILYWKGLVGLGDIPRSKHQQCEFSHSSNVQLLVIPEKPGVCLHNLDKNRTSDGTNNLSYNSSVHQSSTRANNIAFTVMSDNPIYITISNELDERHTESMQPFL
jgi:hypothetical protein